MRELQHGFLVGVLAPFLPEVHGPLGILKNPRTLDDDLPGERIIRERR